MAILSRDDYFTRLHDRLGDDTSDDGIAFLEDMTDTYNDLETRVKKGDSEDWERKYRELDESWKKRYRHRFFNTDNTFVPDDGRDNDDDEVSAEDITVEDLFTSKKEEK